MTKFMSPLLRKSFMVLRLCCRRTPAHWMWNWSVCDPVVFSHLQCGLATRNLDGAN